MKEIEQQSPSKVSHISHWWWTKRTMVEISTPRSSGQFFPLSQPSTTATGQTTSNHPEWST